MKKCTKCGEDKKLSDYYKDARGKNGLYAQCKPCHSKYLNPESRKKHSLPEVRKRLIKKPTPKLATQLYLTYIKMRCSQLPGYRRRKVFLTKADMEMFFRENWVVFMELYKKWVDGGLQRKDAPTIDRINNDGHYDLANIQILSFGENSRKFNTGRVMSKETKAAISRKMSRPRSEETKEKMRQAHLGVRLSDEHRRRISEGKKKMYALKKKLKLVL